MMRFFRPFTWCIVCLCLIAGASVEAQNALPDSPALANSTFGSGSALVGGGGFQLNGTLGEPLAGIMTGGGLTLQGGFLFIGGSEGIITAIRPPVDVAVTDVPDDNGHTLSIAWTLSPDDPSLTGYRIYRSRSPVVTEPVPMDAFDTLEDLMDAEETQTILIGAVDAGVAAFTDACVPMNGVTYYYWVAAVSATGGVSKLCPSGDIVSGIEEDAVPQKLELIGCYPNPFNMATTIRFSLPEECRVTVSVYSVGGQRIETLVNAALSAGTHELRWQPAGLSTGVYFSVLEADGKRLVSKMTLVK